MRVSPGWPAVAGHDSWLRANGSRLDRKARAAAAGRSRVRIVDSEGCADHLLDEVDLGPFQEVERNRVDQNLGIVAGNQNVVLGARFVDAEIILKTGTPAAGYRNAQHGRPR